MHFSCRNSGRQVHSPSRIERHTVVSEWLGRRAIDVWLPPDFDTTQRYALLIAADGHALFDTTETWNAEEWKLDETLLALIESGSAPPLVVLGVHNGGKYRRSEYFPGNALEFMPDSTSANLKTDYLEGESCSGEYLDFIMRELLPWAGDRFAADTNTVYLLGSSSGALSAMYALCEYPGYFRGAACLSTHWPGRVSEFDDNVPSGIMGYLDRRLPAPGSHRWYFDCGDQGLDSLYGRWQLVSDSLFRAHGYTENDYMSLRFSGHAHSERYWASRLPGALTFLFGRNTETVRVQPKEN